LEKVIWSDDGWLRPADGVHKPKQTVPAPDLKPHPWPKEPERDDFDKDKLNIHFQGLRMPMDENLMSLRERPGFLRLKGWHFLNSYHDQAFVARRRQAFKFSAQTALEFEPQTYQQMAGLVVFYDTNNFFYLRVTADDKGKKTLGIITADKGNCSYPLEAEEPVDGWKRCYLKVESKRDDMQFYFSRDESSWKKIGPVFESSKLSDEYCNNYAFTGTFVGVSCQDFTGRRLAADFDYFEYREGK